MTSLYNKYRPQNFSQILGQDATVKGLKNVLESDNISQAYLFSGPRGCGKTSTARIFAKAINCENRGEGEYEPCNECESCKDITEGISFSVEEIDAASRNGVDSIKELIKNVSTAVDARRKVYILDEAHMLTEQASNAFLATLENPPSHVVFILATTDPMKLISTIRSRCIPYSFKLIPADTMMGHVKNISDMEGLSIDETIMKQAVSKGGGSVRDVLSLLESLANTGEVFTSHAYKAVESLAKKDIQGVFTTVALTAQEGGGIRPFAEEILSILRDLFLIQMKTGDLVISPDWGNRQAVADYMGPKNTVKAIEFIGEAISAMAAGYDERVNLEVNLARFCAM